MKTYTKQFIVCIILFVFAFSGLTFYNYVTVKRIDANFAEVYSNLESNIAVLDNKIQATQDLLRDEFDVKTSDLESKLQTEISGQVESVKKEQQKQYIGLTGQISELEKGSQELEEKLLSINVQTKDFTLIVDQVLRSVVSIRTDKGYGSGAIIHPDGYIVTNYHVVKGISQAVVVTSNQKRYPVRLVGFDEDSDLAVVKIEGDEPFKYLKFDRAYRLGEKVIALGNPGGLDFTVTEGIVSTVSRNYNGIDYIQHDVAINPGNSGGPLVNANARIIGINTLKRSNFEGIGFAIEADMVDDVTDELISQDIARLAEQS